jgi:hypothetical protein
VCRRLSVARCRRCWSQCLEPSTLAGKARTGATTGGDRLGWGPWGFVISRARRGGLAAERRVNATVAAALTCLLGPEDDTDDEARACEVRNRHRGRPSRNRAMR